MEDESWQLNLESWRQRRRAASKAYSSRTVSISRPHDANEEQEDSIREYLRQLKTTQSRISDSAIPLMHPVKSSVPLSPESVNRPMPTNPTSSCDSACTSESTPMVPPHSTSSENRTDRSTIRFRLVNNTGCAKAKHLGMEVTASGVDEGPPFHVGRLVQESMAERAQLRTGDEIYSIDNVCCTYKADRPPTLVTLSKVNQLLDRLTAANRAVEVRVIRSGLGCLSEDDASPIRENEELSRGRQGEGDEALASTKARRSPEAKKECGVPSQNPNLLDSQIVGKKGVGQISGANSSKRFQPTNASLALSFHSPNEENASYGQAAGANVAAESQYFSKPHLQTLQSDEGQHLSKTPSQDSAKTAIKVCKDEGISRNNQPRSSPTSPAHLPCDPPASSSFSPRAEASEKVADSQSTPTLPPPPSPKQSLASSEPTSLNCISPPPPPEVDQLLSTTPSESAWVSGCAKYRKTPDFLPPAVSPDIAIELPEASVSSSPEPLAVPLINIASESAEPLNVGEEVCYCEGFVDSPVLTPIAPLTAVETQASTIVGPDPSMSCVRVTDSHYSYVQAYRGNGRGSSAVASEKLFKGNSVPLPEQAVRSSHQSTAVGKLELPPSCFPAEKTTVLCSCPDRGVSDTRSSMQSVRRRSPAAPPSQSALPPARPPRLSVIGTWYNCAGCNQQLGASDLMIVEKLSLFYHLACFVCARCGMQLSDGQNETAVRVRNGLIYCYVCYHKTNVKDNPKKHSRSRRKVSDSEHQGQREPHHPHTVGGQTVHDPPYDLLNSSLQ
nr:unnamed protein product [Spirometra erinaceieuropaei]